PTDDPDDPTDDPDDPTDDPVVSVTVRGEDVTQQPIPRSLSDGDLLVSARDDDWTYIENVDTDAAELYHRPSDPTQQENLAVDPGERERAVIDRLKPVVDDHAALLRERGAAAEAAAAERDEDDEEVDEDLEARLEALGYK
ncbi:sulfatase, partial [Halorubrum tebenquichense DSM 14210]